MFSITSLKNILSIFKGRKMFYIIIIPLTLFSIYATDPDTGVVKDLIFGQNLISTFLLLVPVFLFYAVLHIGRKILHDYVDMGAAYRKAMEHPIGAGLVFVGMGLVLIALAVVIFAATSGSRLI